MKIIHGSDLDRLSSQARDSERLRKNFNLHDSYDDPCQRLFNAVEPKTYIRPHRHTTPPKPETFVVVRGVLDLVLFTDQGEITQVFRLCAQGDQIAVDLPPGIWHAVISREDGTVFFETKPGPYQKLVDKDFAPWAAEEGSDREQSYLEELSRDAEGWLARHGVVDA